MRIDWVRIKFQLSSGEKAAGSQLMTVENRRQHEKRELHKMLS